MPDGPLIALVSGVVSALKASQDVSGLVEDRVYDVPHNKARKPYIRVARFESAPWDTDGTQGRSVTLGLEVHSRPDPTETKEARRIADAITSALHRNPAAINVQGFALVDIQFLTSSTSRTSGDGDVLTRLAFEARLDL